MQTFCPYPNFPATARALDWRRLGKQRVECMQILNVISGKTSGWSNHPAVKMWQGYDMSLCFYSLAMCSEWKQRGYVDNLTPFFQEYLVENKNKQIKLPFWWEDDRVHSSHRQTLLMKDYEWYSKFGWTESPKYEYFWPTKELAATEEK